jgi:hypothetical protein
MADNQIERWRRIQGFENYLISTMGRLYNKTTHKYLYGSLKYDGYVRISLRKNKKSVDKTVHRLIAETFISNPHNLPMVDHKNGDRSDNKIENLRWASDHDNQGNKKKQMGLSSQWKGVCLNNKSNRWRAQIKVNHIQMHLGCFTEELDAAKAYNKKAK